MKVLLVAAKQGPRVLFCMANWTECILLAACEPWMPFFASEKQDWDS
jgi:hypothetical protein